MPKKTLRKTSAKKAAPKKAAPKKIVSKFDETGLTKGQLRKLNALRKSIGDKLGTAAFADWLATQVKKPTTPVDKVAERIAEALTALIKDKKMTIPHGGYLLKRGRGRVIVTRAVTD